MVPDRIILHKYVVAMVMHSRYEHKHSCQADTRVGRISEPPH
jgi:hypothetical protein